MNAESRPLNHEQFLQTYTLNRALGNVGGLEGDTAVEEAEKAWQKMQSVLAKERPRVIESEKLARELMAKA